MVVHPPARWVGRSRCFVECAFCEENIIAVNTQFDLVVAYEIFVQPCKGAQVLIISIIEL